MQAEAPQAEETPQERSYDRSSRYSRDSYDRGSESEENTVPVSGILDIQHEGHGFLRPKFRASDRDIYISSSQIRRFWLRSGDLVEGVGRPPKDNERYFGLLRIESYLSKRAD
jgi:transcription termination factor Rho